MTPEIIDSLQKRFGSADFSRYQVVRGQKYDFCRLQNGATTASSVSFFSKLGASALRFTQTLLCLLWIIFGPSKLKQYPLR